MLCTAVLLTGSSSLCLGQSFSKIDSLKALLSSSQDTTRVNKLVAIAQTYTFQQSDSPLSYAQQALQLADSLHYLTGQAEASRALGIVYAAALGVYPQALEYFLAALAVNETLERPRHIARSLMNVGNTLKKQRSYAEARKYYQRALRIGRAMEDTSLVTTAYINLGGSFTDDGQPEASLAPYQQGLALAQAQHNTSLMVPIHLNLGITYDSLGNDQQALYHAREALRAIRPSTYPAYQVIAERITALAHLRQGHADSALVYAQLALRSAQDFNNPEFKADAFRTLSEVYEAEGDNAQALAYHQQYADLQASILNETTTQQIAQMQTLYETQQKERAIETLQQQRNLQEIRANQEKNLRYSIIIVTILLLGLLAVLYNRYRGKRRALRLISEQKEKIEQQNSVITTKNQENELLLREIHHRVKNNLQLIVSLLNIQSRQFDDQAVLDFVRDGQNRMRSMALIHQNLYQTQRLDRVTFDRYLYQLAEYLREAYQAESRSVFLQVHISSVQLNVDTAVPLGLIVNELISNAFRHKFPDEGGYINVRLIDQTNHRYLLTVADNRAESLAHVKPKQKEPADLRLVQGLAQQIGGTLTVTANAQHEFAITFLDKDTPSSVEKVSEASRKGEASLSTS